MVLFVPVAEAIRQYDRAVQVTVQWHDTAGATRQPRHRQTAETCARVVVERASEIAEHVSDTEKLDLIQQTSEAMNHVNGSAVGGILQQAFLILTR